LSEPIRVVAFAIIESKTLLVKIPEKVERLNAYIRAAKCPLQETPEVLNTVRVDVLPNVGFGVIDHMMNVLFVKLIVRAKRITVDRGTRFHVRRNFAVKRFPLGIRDNHRADFAVTFEQAHYSNLASVYPSKLLALVRVHIARFADKSFVNFDLARERLGKRAALHGESDTVKHKPSGLLRNA
jgi:hypothetical protein